MKPKIKIMKKILLVLIAVALSAGAFAQFSWGIKAGASSNNFAFDLATVTDINSTMAAAEEAAWGFHGGAFVRLSMLGFLVQPEVLFSMTSNDIIITDLATTTSTVKEQKFSRLDIPLLIGIKLGPARLMAGPVASVAIGSPSELFTNSEDLYKAATFGGQAGIGLDLFKKLTLDVRYEFGLSNFGKEFIVGTQTVQLDQNKANAIILSVGLMF